MDIEQIRQLIDLMVENDLSRLEIQEGETHILLRRGQPMVISGAPLPTNASAQPNPGAGASALEPTGAALVASEPETTYIRSPMVGTFYAAPDPESPPFVKVGEAVTPETVVCLVEAMKVFNEIKAEVSGRVTKVLVNNAQAVEYDQPLFAVGPA